MLLVLTPNAALLSHTLSSECNMCVFCLGQAPEVTEEEAIKRAVGSRMDWLDEAFLVALGAYVNAADEQGDAALAGELCNLAVLSHKYSANRQAF